MSRKASGKGLLSPASEKHTRTRQIHQFGARQKKNVGIGEEARMEMGKDCSYYESKKEIGGGTNGPHGKSWKGQPV